MAACRSARRTFPAFSGISISYIVLLLLLQKSGSTTINCELFSKGISLINEISSQTDMTLNFVLGNSIGQSLTTCAQDGIFQTFGKLKPVTYMFPRKENIGSPNPALEETDIRRRHTPWKKLNVVILSSSSVQQLAEDRNTRERDYNFILDVGPDTRSMSNKNLLLQRPLATYKFKVQLSLDQDSIRFSSVCFYCANGNPTFVSVHSQTETNSQLSSFRKLFPDFTKNFHGKTLAVMAGKGVPVLNRFLLDSETKHLIPEGGFQVPMLLSMQKKLNFSMTISEDTFGQKLDNGSFDGLIGKVQEGEIDLGVGAVFTWERYQVVHFLTPNTYQFITFVTNLPGLKNKWQAIFRSFRLKAWLALGVTITFVVIPAYVVTFAWVHAKKSKTEPRTKTENPTLDTQNETENGSSLGSSGLRYATTHGRFGNKFASTEVRYGTTRGRNGNKFTGTSVRYGTTSRNGNTLTGTPVEYGTTVRRNGITFTGTKNEIIDRTVFEYNTAGTDTGLQDSGIKYGTKTSSGFKSRLLPGLREGWAFIFRSLLEQSHARARVRRNAALAFIFVSWMYSSIVIGTAYKSVLMSNMVTPLVEEVPESFEALAENRKYKIYVHYVGGILSKLFGMSKSPSYLKISRRSIQEKSVFKCIEYALKTKSACFSYRDNLGAEANRNFSDRYGNLRVKRTRAKAFHLPICALVPQLAVYKESMDGIVRHQISMGLTERDVAYELDLALIQGKAWARERRVENVLDMNENSGDFDDNHEDEEPIVLSLEHFISSFALLGLGSTLAFLFFSIEVLSKTGQKRKEKLRVGYQVRGQMEDDNIFNTIIQQYTTPHVVRFKFG